MKTRLLAAFVGVGSPMILSHGAHADFTGLTVQLHSSLNISGTTRNVYRVYANFTSGGDRLYLWGGGTSNPVSIQSAVGNFFNPGGAFNTAPLIAQMGTGTSNPIPNMQWGTYATIGVNIADQGVGELGGSFPNPPPPFDVGDLTQLSPGFPTFISGSQITFTGAVFLPGELPGDAQNRADFAPDGDAALRVLMMQLTVNANSHVQGTIPTLIWKPEGSATTVTHSTPLTFSSVPAPGGLALFAVAVLLKGRRRLSAPDCRCTEARS